jgi:GNAT superfamily N-acetyltransferase
MAVTIAPVGPDQTDAFAGIWVPWLRKTIGRDPEPEDLEVMADPASYYAQTGGTALLAVSGGEVIGAVAVKGLGQSGFEFCKLVVADAARGQGAGRTLVEACVDYARDRGGPDLYLQSFNALDVALGLYRRMGFVDTPPPPEMTVLARTEVIMKMRLRDATAEAAK